MLQSFLFLIVKAFFFIFLGGIPRLQQFTPSALPARWAPTRQSHSRSTSRRQEGVPHLPSVALRPALIREGAETATGTRGSQALQTNG